MKTLRRNDKVVVYHKIGEEGDHYYSFYDGKKKIELDWGETGLIPNADDRFPNSDRDIDLILDDILWAEMTRETLESFEVYSEGVPEWEVLDKLPVYATEIQWSLIYRKLKGKRGCTPLLPWEAQRLIDMIRNKNRGRPIANSQFTGGFDWDRNNRKIITTQYQQNYPCARDFNFNVLSKICNLQMQKRSYEVHLQLYFTENIGINSNLNSIVGNNLIWFGNEVAY
ncbi:MAG: hypothetical protein NC827_02790 [Candidatus Omnitrophica bacterium]|nr:hypothetical protein [Candidatus Omnitrophota bacterium]MCM8802220.1 hypothetical protein [Candidatus Omnitrophota bacterium]